MSVQMTMTGGKNLSKNLKEAMDKGLKGEVKSKMEAFAYGLIMNSPVYPNSLTGRPSPYSSGAYIMSHNFKINNTSGRGSRKDSEFLALGSYGDQEGYGNIITQVQIIDNYNIEDIKSLTFRNDSEHAGEVESGLGWPNGTDGYHTYENARRHMERES